MLASSQQRKTSLSIDVKGKERQNLGPMCVDCFKFPHLDHFLFVRSQEISRNSPDSDGSLENIQHFTQTVTGAAVPTSIFPTVLPAQGIFFVSSLNQWQDFVCLHRLFQVGFRISHILVRFDNLLNIVKK